MKKQKLTKQPWKADPKRRAKYLKNKRTLTLNNK